MRDGVGYRNGDVCFVCFMTILMEKKVCYLITVDKFDVVTYIKRDWLTRKRR